MLVPSLKPSDKIPQHFYSGFIYFRKEQNIPYIILILFWIKEILKGLELVNLRLL